jgi:hypothetical protein
MGATAAAALAAIGIALPASATTTTTNSTPAGTPKLVDAAAGMHAGLSTVQMLGAATLSKNMVSCAVGQMGLGPDTLNMLAPVVGNQLGMALSPVLGGGFSGPFAMLMYSLDVASYKIDRSAMTLTAQGTVRSITKIGGLSIEDASVPYVAVAQDNKTKGSEDTFFLSFKTPFWSVGFNPLATPSKFVSGWSQFGGSLIMGEANVAS